jgi:hypothetical protein
MRTISDWFKEAVPKPTQRNMDIQLGCHLEEVHEMLSALSINSKGYDTLKFLLNQVSDELKQGKATSVVIDRQELLDSLADQNVTGIGVAHMQGLAKFDEALAEVNASNWSKFENGKAVFDDNGKIKKGASYFKPCLSRFL